MQFHDESGRGNCHTGSCLLPFVAGCPERFSWPLLIEYGIAGTRVTHRSLVLLTIAVLSRSASAWNIPGHMLSGAT